MSIRKEHRPKLQPVIAILKSALSLSPTQTHDQEQMTSNIIEELLQTNIISKIQCSSTLKIIIYELILNSFQQLPSDPTPNKNLAGLLTSIKEILCEMIGEREESTLKRIDNKNLRQLGYKQKNKYNIFVSYCNQFLNLYDKFNEKEQQALQVSDVKEEKQQALIVQLQTLVYKKDEQLKSTQQELQVLIQQNTYCERVISELEEQLSAFRSQTQRLTSAIGKLENENSNLQSSIRQLLNEGKKRPESAELLSFEETLLLTPSHPATSTVGPNQANQEQMRSEEYLRVIMSQALSLQAMVP